MRSKNLSKQRRVRSDVSRRKGRPGSVSSKPSQAAVARIEALTELLPQLGRAIGPLCELVLHEKVGDALRVRVIVNNHISGRTIGDPPGVIVRDGHEVDLQEPLFNYIGFTEDRKRLRCSLIPVRLGGEVIGAICVNFLVHDLQNARDALAGMLATEPDTQGVEEFVPAHGDILDGIIDATLRERGRPAASLSKHERLALVSMLKARGVLNIRGAIERIAARLGISRTAVYNYLKEIEQDVWTSTDQKIGTAPEHFLRERQFDASAD